MASVLAVSDGGARCMRAPPEQGVRKSARLAFDLRERRKTRPATSARPARKGEVLLLRRLTSLRAFAALAVFVVHLDAHQIIAVPWGLANLGGLGVAFFFVLSGFVLAWGTDPNLSARTFYRRRFARVYPSDFATLLIAAVVPVVAVARSWKAGIANAFMMQAWFRNGQVVYGMNGVSWSLSCEAFFYAMFPVAALLVRRSHPSARWAAAITGLALAAIAYVYRPLLADHFPPVRISEFILGLVAGIAFREGWRPRISPVLVLGALTVGLTLATALASPLANVVVAVPFLLVIVHAAGKDVERRPGWLPSRTLVFAGEASFAFYLVHELVIVNLRQMLIDQPVVDAFTMLFVASAIAAALHLIIERPCNRLLRDRVPSVALAPGSMTAAS